MAEIASAFVSLVPSAKGFGAKLDSQISGDVDSSGKKAGSKWGNALKAGAAVGVAALGAVVVKTLSDSVTAASEAQQAVGGVEAVFGKYADGVLRDSKKAAQGLGLSAASYNELITVSGAMLKNKGIEDFAEQSKGLITVGADLAAMFGGTTKEAVDALNSAMRGESDPIERYGIALNAAAIEAEAISLGLVKNVKNLDVIKAAQNTAVLAQRKYNAALKENGKGSDEALAAESSLIRSKAALTKALDGQKVELTGAQKAQASLSLVQKQSADATGAFAKESDTLAGQQQRLGAEFDNLKVALGTALLPALTEGAGTARLLVRNFDLIGPVLGVVAAGMLTFKAASLAAAAATAVQAAGTTAATGATWSLNAALRANPIGIVVTLLTALGVGLVVAYKKSDTFREIVDNAFSGVKAAASVMWDGIKFVFKAMKDGFEAVGKAGTWLWNNALQPAFKFIVGGIASILDLWSSMLGTLAKVPGFGWAKDAADAMANAANKARDMANGIQKIPSAKTVKVTVAFKYTGLRGGAGPTRGGNEVEDAILPRLAATAKKMPAAIRALDEQVTKAIKSGGKKQLEAATKAYDLLRAKFIDKRDELRSTLDGLKGDFASLSDSVKGAFAGDLFEATTGAGFIATLTAKRAELASLLTSFATLRGWGLSPAFLSQLFASGNGALITELAGMGQAGAVATGSLFGEVSSLGSQLGNAVAQNDMGPRIDETNRQLSQVNAQLAYLADDIGKALDGAASKARRDGKGRGKK